MVAWIPNAGDALGRLCHNQSPQEVPVAVPTPRGSTFQSRSVRTDGLRTLNGCGSRAVCLQNLTGATSFIHTHAQAQQSLAIANAVALILTLRASTRIASTSSTASGLASLIRAEKEAPTRQRHGVKDTLTTKTRDIHWNPRPSAP
jgi:hypothetical protein